ncbi:MAG: response regulator [Bacteroidales bacterium]|nr:response regulator [Bacteroidales bacterium]
MNPKIKILYVDDEKLNLMLFESFLSEEYEIFTALNGYRALELLVENPEISAIFSDLQMPEMDGVEFIRTAKEKYPEKMYSLVTGFSISSPIIQEAMETKLITKHLRKPINKHMLLKIIDEAVNNYCI